MSELPGLFYEHPTTEYRDADDSDSSVAKVILGTIVIGLVIAFGVIAYFGVGPMLVKPYTPPTHSSAPDAATVLGLNNSQASNGLIAITDDSIRRPLVQRLMSEVEVSEGEQVSVLQIQEVPRHDEGSLFAQAKVNDILFVLMQSGNAYLYRPVEDVIVASGSTTVEQ